MRVKGGLGNQLFQYAAAYALAKRLKQEFQFDIAFTDNMTSRGYKLPFLMVDTDRTVGEESLNWKISYIKNVYVNKFLRVVNSSRHKCGDTLYWLETKDIFQNEFFSISAENIYVDGYFQSYKYFEEYIEDFRRQMVPKYEQEQQFWEMLSSIKSSNSVAVHVRRSDFKHDKHPFHYVLDSDYYSRSIEIVNRNIVNPIYFWFSDDIEWIKEQIGDKENYIFVSLDTKYPDIDEFMLMKNCKHIIAANSTFSWWAAWLNPNEDAFKIVPKRKYGMEGMIPPEWIKL